MKARLVVLLGVACRAPAPGGPPATAAGAVVATASAGPFAFDPDANSLGDLHWDGYAKLRATLPGRVVALRQPPAGASAAAMYGLNMISEGKNVGWMLDGDQLGGYRFAFDVDHDGDLGDDPVHRMVRAADGWSVDVEARPWRPGGPPLRTRVVFDGHVVRVHEAMTRAGTIRIDGRETAFAIRCRGGDCSQPRNVEVGFDLDEDGIADLGLGSIERYSPGDSDPFVVLSGRTYSFEVAADGGSLTVRRAAVARAPRSSLKVGTAAPDFALVVAGRHHTLAAARGRVVVLAFGAAGCHFCVANAPWLAAIPARGADVITIATESSRDEPAIAQVP